MSDLMNPYSPQPEDEPDAPPLNSKRNWLLLGVISLVTVPLMTVLVDTGMDYLYNVWPEESYRKLYEQPWLGLNVRALNFQSDKEIARAQATLEQKSSNPAEKDNPIPHYLLAELYNDMSQPKKAVLQYRLALQVADQSWLSKIQHQQLRDNAHAALAVLYYEQGQQQQSKEELAQIAAADENREADLLFALQDTLDEPDRGDFHLLLGKAFRDELKLGIAMKELQQAETLSQSPQLRLEASNYLKTQMPQGTQELSPLARYYGLAARSARNYDENLPKAASLFEKAVRENPQFILGYNDLAIIYREMKDYPKAVANAQDAIRQNRNFYNPHLILGDIALDHEAYAEAISHYQAAKAILSRMPLEDHQNRVANIENQIAYAYEALHQYDQASRHYQDALSLALDAGDAADDDYEYAQHALARLQQRKLESAEQKPNINGKQISYKP